MLQKRITIYYAEYGEQLSKQKEYGLSTNNGFIRNVRSHCNSAGTNGAVNMTKNSTRNLSNLEILCKSTHRANPPPNPKDGNNGPIT